ncbi:hypothetical protein ATANTOWER_002659 [Ataeniobius toweri]|uniref:Uncharacterized protein n=1 Tax=Ataeniobius toweri TaxID=208326 RepID=A0ABU7AAI9_9TELE|nr:hypothetical protein [Ataeniobius toweri]
MVHVYSVSSSSLTVQLYSRSRFLRLPLMNRLNIFTTDSPLSFCVYGTRTIKTPHQRASECHTERTPRSPKRPAAAHSATIVVPIKFSLRWGSALLNAKSKGCPHPGPGGSSGYSVSAVEQRIISHAIHRCHFGRRAGPSAN